MTGKHYRGINVLILGMDTRAFMSGDPRWMTYQQAKEKNWQVRKGEKATTIFFYKPLEIDDPEAEDGSRTIPMLKSYSVFHASQIDRIPGYKPPTVEEAPWQRPEAADIILKNSGAAVRIHKPRSPKVASRERVNAGGAAQSRAKHTRRGARKTRLHQVSGNCLIH
jgi:antirestriction protein ArdC